MREGRAGEGADGQAHSLFLSRTLVTPTTSTPPLARGNTSRVFPLCSISRQPIWAGTQRQIYSSVQGPPGSKRRQVGLHLRLENKRLFMGAICNLSNYVLVDVVYYNSGGVRYLFGVCGCMS
jgi:hypothetical protein